MAKYGFGTYGIPKYGEVDSNRLYYSSGIFGWSYDFQTISLTWKSIISDPDDAPYVPIAWRLVRSYVGVPDSPYSGTLLDSGALPSEFRLTYIDEDTSLLENHEVTYTIWVFTAEVDNAGNILDYAESRWINCGSTVVNTVAQTQTAEYFKRWLPAAWLNEVYGVGDATGEYDETILSKIIDAYSFEFDKIKVQASLLQDYADAANIPSVLLKNKVTDLGFLYEPSLGDTYHRSLYKNGNYINSLKGTPAGIAAYATALTHWGTSVTVGNNLLLDYNDSSFEESVGRWAIDGRSIFGSTELTGGTWSVSHQKYATSLADLGTAVTPPDPKVYDQAFPPRNLGFMVVHAAGSSSQRYLHLPQRTADKTIYGVPVTPGKRYVFTGWVRTLVARPQNFLAQDVLTPILYFFDKNGVVIESSAYGPGVVYDNFWQETNTGWVDNVAVTSGTDKRGQVAPANAAYASVEFLITKRNTDVHFLFDMCQFLEVDGSDTEVFEDARVIKVNIEGDVENYILNPSFDSGTSWWQGYNAELVQDFNSPEGTKLFGNAVAKLTALSTAKAALISDWQSVESGTPYSVGFFVSGPAGKHAVARIEYSSRQSYEEQVEILTDEDGSYYPTTPYYADSEEVELLETATRISVFAVSPVQASDYSDPLVKVSVYFPDAEEGDEFYVDSVMLVESPEVKDYFQGDGGPIPADPNANIFYPTADCLWDTRSHTNLVSNSTFDTTDLWTAAAGTTLTSVNSGGLFGTKRGNVSASGGGSISTTVYYPNGACIGGEDVVVSAYVKNVAGLYSISTNGQTNQSFRVSSANATSWTRIDVKRIAEVGETSFTITISLSEAGTGTKVFHVDGVQAEFGIVATPFVDPASSYTKTLANPAQAGHSVHYAYSSMVNAGYSFYANRYPAKYERLKSSLNLVTPLGSTYAVRTIPSNVSFNEIDNSLLPAPSFELNLDGWTGESATLKRSISRGTLFDELLTQGAAFAKVIATASGEFGIISDLTPVLPVTGYYTSIAVKPENEDAYGTYTLKIKWYAESEGFLREKVTTLDINRHDRWAYLDIVAPGSRSAILTLANVDNNYVTLTTLGAHKFSVGEDITVSVNGYSAISGTTTIEAVTEDTFSFTRSASNMTDIEITGSAQFANTGVAYAKIEVLCDPTSPGIGRTFHLDKAIFRE